MSFCGINFTKEGRDFLRRCIFGALAYEDLQIPCSVEILLTGDDEIRKINLEQRSQNKVTDVLSFPNFDILGGEQITAEQGDTHAFLGSVVLSLERARAQAEEFGHSFEREAGYLTIHSILHLLGYDHENENEKLIMREHEERIWNLI